MRGIVLILVAIVSTIVATYAFFPVIQIVRGRQKKGLGLLTGAIVILAAAAFAVHIWLAHYRLGFYIAVLVSFILSLRANKKRSEKSIEPGLSPENGAE